MHPILTVWLFDAFNALERGASNTGNNASESTTPRKQRRQRHRFNQAIATLNYAVREHLEFQETSRQIRITAYIEGLAWFATGAVVANLIQLWA